MAIIASLAVVIVLLGGVAAFLPLLETGRAEVAGWLLLVAGLAELGAAGLRRLRHLKIFGSAAGAVTAIAGLFFIFSPYLGILAYSDIVIIWLIVRGIILLWGTARSPAPPRNWTSFAGTADLLLALLLIAGLPIAHLVVAIFGPTLEVVASLSLIFAASFIVTGVTLLFSAGAERRVSVETPGL